MSEIERDSPIPLYYQLKELLAQRIAGGEWQPGDMLPTEEMLTEQFQLSRSTVRQALKELELEGKITRHRGRGTFVSRAKLSHSPDSRFSLTDVLQQQGMRPGWKVLSADWERASGELAEQLKLDAGTPLFTLRRLRLANDEPIGYHIAHVSPVAAPAIDQEKLEEGGSLNYLSGSGILNDSEAYRTLEARLVPDDVARLLDVQRGSPILRISRLVLNQAGVPIERLLAIYRGDRFQYHIRPPQSE